MTDLTLRATEPADEDFLWEMLFYASHSYEEPGVTFDDIRENPDLVPYMTGWASGGHVGVVAVGDGLLGAAWVREMTDQDRDNPVFLDLDTPELAIAVVPGREGRGIGSALLGGVLDQARGRFPRIVLSARLGNPAVRLYERHGFQTISDMTNRVGTRSVVMVVDLAGKTQPPES